MVEVTASSTPASSDEIRLALDAAWSELSRSARDYFHALILVETNRGRSLKQWNVGNLSAGGFSNGVEKLSNSNYWRPPWFSEPGELHDRMLAGEVPSAFRAFDDLQTGVAAFVQVLRGERYRGLVSSAERDDPKAFVSALRDSGYSSGYGPAHVDTFRSIIGEIRVTPMQAGDGRWGVAVPLVIAGTLLLTGLVFWGTIKPRSRAITRFSSRG